MHDKRSFLAPGAAPNPFTEDASQPNPRTDWRFAPMGQENVRAANGLQE